VGETVILSPTTGGNWTSSDPAIATITNAGEVNGVSAGTADMIFTDATTGCSSSATNGTITVSVGITPTFDPVAPICTGEPLAPLPTTSTNGITGTWSPALDNTQTTTYTFISDANQCADVTNITITVNPEPTINAGNNITICEGESTILSASGANSYVWNNGVTNGQPFTPPSGTTTYTVVGEVNGCVGTDQVDVTTEAAPPISFDVSSEVDCAFSQITLVNTSPGNSSSCIWNMGDGTQLSSCDSVTYSYSQTGCFDVSLAITSQAGCQGTITVADAICLESTPIADFSSDPMVAYTSDPSFEFTNESSGATSYEWDFGDFSATSTEANPSHTYVAGEEGFYDVTLVAYNSNGCSDTAVRRIEIREELIFWVPNAFTPDQDQYNEVFQPVFTSGFDIYDYNLLIFNRWGEVLFESNNALVGWDGTYGGQTVKDGVYVWKIEFKDKYTDEIYTRTGHVTLIK